MARPLSVALAQAAPVSIGASFEVFAQQAAAAVPATHGTRLVAFPELHLFETGLAGESRNAALVESAQSIDGPLVRQLAELAGDLGVWLIPGSIVEPGEDGTIYNTAVVLSPQGKLVAQYRKMFPWRPTEPYRPGDRFVVFEIESVGRIGLSICYDAWFPEFSRQLAWLGAEVVVNLVKTTTIDRAQELVLARANAIVNQTFVLSVNCAGPIGVGQSVIVDPEGRVRVQSPSAESVLLTDVIDLDAVSLVREYGTAGTNRMWDQFRSTDSTIELPMYDGRINPSTWKPAADRPTPTAQ
jgi:predicted amidohydrolase